ncbi:MAG: hypothetical protein LW837_19300, partial [Roseomonas sp.]|nr:hypothetical protein [Roseomonas sp.]
MTLLTLLQSQGAPGGITGTANITLGALTVAGTGDLGPEPITGSANITLGALTVAGTGTVSGGGITGTANITLGALTVAGTGTLGPEPPAPPVTGPTGGDDAPARTEDIRRIAK